MSTVDSIAIDTLMPNFKVHTTSGKTITNQDLKGKNVVFYFYPKDNTPGCTQESKDFTTFHATFEKLNCVVYGVSRDSIKSHEKFKEKYCFPFELISDEDEQLCTLFDVLKPKNLFGKLLGGINRSTFLFDSHGKLKQIWRNVKVSGHVEEVIKELEKLEASSR